MARLRRQAIANWRRRVDSRSGRTLESINPATELPLTVLAEAGEDDVDLAVIEARRALEAPSWGGMSPHARTQVLLQIDRHADELAVLETLDNGGPLKSTIARAANCAEVFRYYAGWPTKIYGTTNPIDPSMEGYKHSGFDRQMGAESIGSYTQTKSVLMRL